jgi:hypothetical protein
MPGPRALVRSVREPERERTTTRTVLPASAATRVAAAPR